MRKLTLLPLLVSALVLVCSAVAWGSATAGDLMSVVQQADGVLTRGEFAAMLVRASGMTGGETAPAELLRSKGIMLGYPGGEFGLERGISRVEAAALVGRTLGLSDAVAPPEVDNASVAPPGVHNALPAGHWGYNLYGWLTRQGLVDGDPTDVLTEEEGASFLSEVFSTSPEAMEILKKTQARSLEAMSTPARVTMSGVARMVPRPGAQGAEKMPSAIRMHVIQEMKLPDVIHQKTTIAAEVPGAGSQEFSSEMYLTGSEMYQLMPDPGTGEFKWYRFPEEVLPDMKKVLEQAKNQAEVVPPELEDFLHYQLLGTREVGGEEVYEVAFYGRIDDFERFVRAATARFGEQGIRQSMSEAMGILKSMSYFGIQYVGVKDYLPRSAEYSFIIGYAEKFQGQPVPIEAMRMSMKIEKYEFDEGIKIEIPREALDAPVLKPGSTLELSQPGGESVSRSGSGVRGQEEKWS